MVRYEGVLYLPLCWGSKIKNANQKDRENRHILRCKLSLLGVTMERLKGLKSSGVLLPVSFQQSVKVVASELTLSTEGGGKETSKQLVLKWYSSGFHVSDTSSSAQEPEFQWQNFASSKVVAYILTHPQEKRLSFTGVHSNMTQLKSSVFFVKIELCMLMFSMQKSKAGSLPHEKGKIRIIKARLFFFFTEGHFKAKYRHIWHAYRSSVYVYKHARSHIKTHFLHE